MTMNLRDYLAANAVRCARDEAEAADLIFFGVKKAPAATADGLLSAIKAHKGEFNECNPMDGAEHSYIELGGWIGDQGAALSLIGLGSTLGMWRLLTPKTMLGNIATPEMVQQMAGMGMVSLQV